MKINQSLIMSTKQIKHNIEVDKLTTKYKEI